MLDSLVKTCDAARAEDAGEARLAAILSAMSYDDLLAAGDDIGAELGRRLAKAKLIAEARDAKTAAWLAEGHRILADGRWEVDGAAWRAGGKKEDAVWGRRIAEAFGEVAR